MMKRLALAVSVIALALLTGCQKNEPVETKVNEPVTIRTVSMFGASDPSCVVYNEILAEFMEEYDYITVVDESSVSDETWKTSVVADFCAGNEPDVLQFFTDATANQLIAMDKFVTLDEIREVYPDYAKDTYDWALEQVANLDGVKRAVPTTGFWEGLYCNKDLFDQYDIELPKDDLSFKIAVKKFREVGIVPVACSLINVPHYWTEYLLLSSLGAQEYIKPFTELTPGWEEGLESFKELRDSETFPDNTDTIDNSYATNLFVQKKAAMLLEGNWFLPGVKDVENTVVVPFPKLWEKEKVIVGGMTSGFYISRRAWDNPLKRDAAVKFVMAQTCEASVQRYFDNGGGITTTATDVEPKTDYTPLEESARKYVEEAEMIVLATDSRMEPVAYQELVAGILDISEGGSERTLLSKVLELNNKNSD